jgi:hypothetical protein
MKVAQPPGAPTAPGSEKSGYINRAAPGACELAPISEEQ